MQRSPVVIASVLLASLASCGGATSMKMSNPFRAVDGREHDKCNEPE